MIDEFKLNQIESQRVKEFEENHRHPDIYKGAIGGHISYIFTPNSIGVGKSVRCGICDSIRDITDYNW